MKSSKQTLPAWAIEDSSITSIPTATEEVIPQPALEALRRMNKSASQHAVHEDDGDSLERGVPLRHVDSTPREAEFDDISSIQQSTFVEEQSAPKQQRAAQSVAQTQGEGAERTASQPNSNNNNAYVDPAMEAHQRSIRRKNIAIIATLLLFVGIVAAIGAGVVKAVRANPIGGANDVEMEVNEVTEANATDESVDNSAIGGDESQEVEVEMYNYTEETDSELGFDSEQDDRTEELLFEQDDRTNEILFDGNGNNPTTTPYSSTPSLSPTTNCIPLEIGIIFNQNANTTSWLLVAGTDTISNNNLVWKSIAYDDSYNYKAGTFQTCLPAKQYSFIFTDGSNDDDDGGMYVLSSEGNVIATSQATVTFTLPFTVPDATDSNNDGLDDRLGTLMSYDSFDMVEGVDCEPFRIEIETDNSGIETTWELYDGNNNDAGKLIANGGPYGSNSLYEYEYCLESRNRYSFYIYDWASDGLCCVSGKGSFTLSSEENIIHQSSGNFGAVNVTRFVLPLNPSSNKAPTNAPTSLSSTLIPTTSLVPSFSPTKRDPKKQPTPQEAPTTNSPSPAISSLFATSFSPTNGDPKKQPTPQEAPTTNSPSPAISSFFATTISEGPSLLPTSPGMKPKNEP